MTPTSFTKPQADGMRIPLTNDREATVTAGVRVIQFGGRQLSTYVPGGATAIELSSLQLRELSCESTRLRVRYSGSTVTIGPAIAIYSLPFTGPLPFGPQTGLCTDVANLCKAAGVDLSVITPGLLDATTRATRGYRLHPKQSWKIGNVPWPDYLWRRSTVRPPGLEKILDEEEYVLTKTTMLGTLPRVDSEKWALYQELSCEQELRPYLPETHLIKHASQVLESLHTLGDIYMKPVRGTQGQRIARIRTQNGEIVQTTAKAAAESALQHKRPVPRLQSSDALLQYWQGRLRGNNRYIAQKTIPLMLTKQGEPFDVRFLIQAIPQAEPVCTACVIKLGSVDAVTTNLHTGGQALLPDAICDRLTTRDRQRFREGLRDGEEAAKAAFTLLADKRPGLAELGVDIAICTKGKAWILEVNPCPGRRMLREVSPELRRLSLERVIEYAVFCTGF